MKPVHMPGHAVAFAKQAAEPAKPIESIDDGFQGAPAQIPDLESTAEPVQDLTPAENSQATDEAGTVDMTEEFLL